MEIQLKRERCNHKVSTFLPDSVKEKLDAFAEKEGVKESAAVRYILALFLSGDQNEIEAFVKSKAGISRKQRSKGE